MIRRELLLNSTLKLTPDHWSVSWNGTRPEVGGVRFKAGPNFRLSGGMGLVDIQAGTMPGLTFKECHFLGHAGLDPESTDAAVNGVNGISAEWVDGLSVQDSRFELLSGVGIRIAGCRGTEVRACHSRRTLGLLAADYFVTLQPHAQWIRANSGLFVHGYCTHRDGQGGQRSNPNWKSIYDPRRGFGGNGLNVTAADFEIVDFAVVGETNVCVKTVDAQRGRIARCHGGSIMAQGSCYWDAVQGPHSVHPTGGQLFWPFGQGSYGKDLTIEDCVLNPRMNLGRFYDDPQFGGNTIQLSYPQARTVVKGCHLWSEPGWPAAIQLAEGVDVTITGNVFHGVTDPASPDGIHVGDSSPAWPSKISNADWHTANQWVTP